MVVNQIGSNAIMHLFISHLFYSIT